MVYKIDRLCLSKLTVDDTEELSGNHISMTSVMGRKTAEKGYPGQAFRI